MTDEEQQRVNDSVHAALQERIGELENRAAKIEMRLAEKDTRFAVINTKLSAILWGMGVGGTAIIGGAGQAD